MHIEPELQKAVGRFDWQTVETWLLAVEPAEVPNTAKNLVDVVLRDGYLILRRKDTGLAERRDNFLQQLTAFLRDCGLEELVHRREEKLSSVRHTEEAYQTVLTSLHTDLLVHISTDEFVWAAIRAAESAVREMVATVKRTLHGLDHFVDPVTAKLPVDADGVLANPDAVLNMIQGTLTGTLKMLGYGNGWFGRLGELIVPDPVATTGRHLQIASGSAYLAVAWNQIERSDGRCRYFDGKVTRGKIEIQNAKDPKEGPHRANAVSFSFDNKGEVELHVAGERLRRMCFSFFVSLDRDQDLVARVVAAPPIPPAPGGYVSVEEAFGALTLSHIFFRSVFDITTSFGGLSLLEWLRGYAVIQKLARQHFYGPEPPNGIVLVDRDSIIIALTEHGLPTEKAHEFFRLTSFGRVTDDLFDAPFVQCRDGQYCFIVGVAAQLNPTFVVLSQLSSLQCNMGWKGVPFEADTLELFRTHGIDSATIHRNIDGKEVEIDCVAIWDDTLFVCENKNYFLPRDNPQNEFWFLQDQVDAARQVLEKVAAIEAHPEVIGEALGKRVAWQRVVPVVLNGAPFSLPGPIQGVHFYDASALHRFFEDGFIGYSVDRGKIPRQPIAEGRTDLWAGASPVASDLVKQMERPEQVMRLSREYRRVQIAFPISRQLHVSTMTLDRVAATVGTVAESMGIKEDQLIDRVAGQSIHKDE